MKRDLTWQSDALCAQQGLDAWFPEKGVNNAPAVRICEECPVKQECLQYSLEVGAEYGVWGGCSANKRKQMPEFTVTPQGAEYIDHWYHGKTERREVHAS